jgi:biopolymer transport protein ExbD
MRQSSIAVLAALTVVGCSSEKALRAACDKGDPGACDVLSARYAYGDGVHQDPARSAELAARTMELCADGGVSASCRRFPMVRAVPLDMPKMATSGEPAVVFTIVLAIDGTVTVDGKAVANDEEILPLATRARDANPELRAMIKAGSAVSHGRVIHALDLLKQAGIGRIAFGVSPVPPKSGHD